MKTRTIILVLGLLGAGFTMAVGGIGLGGLHWANAGIAGTVVATRATQEATLGDMMHEGLRGDVFEALFHAQRGHAEGVAKAVKDAAEHGDEFISRVKALRALPLTAGQAEAAAQLAPLVDRYAAMGKQLSVQAGSDLPGALAGLPEFERLFETLAAVQDKMIEDIEAHATALQASTEQDRRLSSQVMWAVTLLATGVLVVMALGVTRSMTRHLGGEPRTVRALLHRVADGDLTLQVRLQAGDTASVMAGLAETVQRLRSTVRSVRDNAEAVTAAASEVHAGSDDLAQRTSQQAAALDAAVQALERISQQLTQSGEHAARASELAGQTSTVARQSGEAVQAVVSTMSEIQRASQRIADITSVIDGIAFQTNLLALNAAVEAARAGEQGRGFAVVAGEVRSLAGRSAQAAQEIKQLIGQSVDTIEQGSGHVQAAGSAMAQLLGSVQQVSDLINDMAQASHAQGQDLSEVRDTVRQLDEVTQQNAALVEQSAAAAGALSGRAGQLSEAVHRFQVDPVT